MSRTWTVTPLIPGRRTLELVTLTLVLRPPPIVLRWFHDWKPFQRETGVGEEQKSNETMTLFSQPEFCKLCMNNSRMRHGP